LLRTCCVTYMGTARTSRQAAWVAQGRNILACNDPANYCGVVSLVRTKHVLRPPRVPMAARCWFGVVIAVALGGDLHQRSISLKLVEPSGLRGVAVVRDDDCSFCWLGRWARDGGGCGRSLLGRVLRLQFSVEKPQHHFLQKFTTRHRMFS
jgi:hypothetical protein